MAKSPSSEPKAPRVPRTARAAFSVPVAADYLDVSEPTVWRLLRDNTLTRVKLRGRTLIAKADCDNLLTRGVALAHFAWIPRCGHALTAQRLQGIVPAQLKAVHAK